MKSKQLFSYLIVFCILTFSLSSCSSDRKKQTALRRIAILEDARTLAGDELGSYFNSSEPEIRKRAVIAAGRIGDPAINSGLIKLLHDSEETVRQETIFALGQIGDESAFEPLSEYYSFSEDKEKILVIEAIGKIGGEQSEEFLFRKMSLVDTRLLDNIIYALTWMKAKNHLPQIASHLTSADPEVKQAAAYACFKMADSTFNVDIYRFLKDNDPLFRRYLIGAVGRIAHPVYKKSIIPYLDDKDRFVKIEAIRAAGKAKINDAVEKLLIFTRDENFQIYSEAINSLGEIGSKKAAQPLLNMIRTDSGEKIPFLVVALTKIEGERFLPFLDTYSDHPDPIVRRSMGQCLSLIGNSDALRLVGDMIQDDDPTVRTAVVGGLQGFGELGHELLLKTLDDSDWAVRTAAIEGIGKLNDMNDFPALKKVFLQHLDKTDSEEIRTILNVMFQLDKDNSIPLLNRALKSPLPTVENLSRKLLRESGQEVSPLPAPPDAGYPQNFGLPVGQPSVSIYTAKGRIEIELFGNEAPVLVENMLKLIRNRFYDNTSFHRIVPNFVVQGGDPRGDGWGGPGYTVRDQINQHKFNAGAVGLPTSGFDTGGCQFFICLTAQPHLDGRYTVIGKVTRGFETLMNLREGDIIEEISLSAKSEKPKYREM